MTPGQIRIRTAVRFVVLTVTVCLWLFVAHAIPAATAAVMGL